MLHSGITLRNAILRKQTSVKLLIDVILAIFHSQFVSWCVRQTEPQKIVEMLGTKSKT